MKKLANTDSTNSYIVKEQRMATGEVNISRGPRGLGQFLRLDHPRISLKCRH